MLTKFPSNIKPESLAFQLTNFYLKLLNEETKGMKDTFPCKSSGARIKVDKCTVTTHCGSATMEREALPVGAG